MLSNKGLMKYLRDIHKIEIKSYQSKDLRNIGYYHGYKGYRFIRESNNKITFNSFSEVIALNKFDNELKALIYPKIMFIENALKSYVIESVLKDSKSEYLDDIFAISLTDYKNSKPGSKSQKDKIKMRLKLKNSINSMLLREYSNNKQIVNHFFEINKTIPIWAIFESLALGEFATFFDCSNLNIKVYTSKLLNLPSNLDSNGELIKTIIYSLVDLRNAIAHNGVIFDTRFKTGKINNLLVQCLKQEIGICDIDFRYITSYILLIVYLLRKMKVTKRDCNIFVYSFLKNIKFLRKNVPSNICDQILGTEVQSNIETLISFIKKS